MEYKNSADTGTLEYHSFKKSVTCKVTFLSPFFIFSHIFSCKICHFWMFWMVMYIPSFVVDDYWLLNWAIRNKNTLLFNWPKSDHRLAIVLHNSVRCQLVEICLMWHWRVKITLPLQKSCNLSLPCLTESCQTKPVAEVWSKFWSLSSVKILKLKFC